MKVNHTGIRTLKACSFVGLKTLVRLINLGTYLEISWINLYTNNLQSIEGLILSLIIACKHSFMVQIHYPIRSMFTITNFFYILHIILDYVWFSTNLTVYKKAPPTLDDPILVLGVSIQQEN